MESFGWGLTGSIFLFDLAIRIGLSLRVIMRKRAPSVSIAWLVIILLFPFAGAITYLLFGETRLGERRADRLVKGRPMIRQWSTTLRHLPNIDWSGVNPERLPLNQQVHATTGIPTMGGNHLELLDCADQFFTCLIADIQQAKEHISLEFYILNEGGHVEQLLAALVAASHRGIRCRLLLDSIGSKKFFKSPSAKRLRKAGVEIKEALPAGLVRALFMRIDLRNHRKIALIDGTIGYTGSQNLVDPRFFKQDSGVGAWVDVMVRITGPVVELLQVTFFFDWLLERGEELSTSDITKELHPVEERGEALVQLAPSGPGYGEDTIHNLLLTTIYAARKEIVLTTPYFVPDNALNAALQSAAQRGVQVWIIVPRHNDSLLVHYASRARYDALTRAGVHIRAFTGGLLHAKTITVDGDFCLFGSVNLDMRSFWLNFEMTLFVYNQDFTRRVRKLQQEYLQQTIGFESEQFTRRSFGERLLENVALLVSPLL
nr:cardiolipin synthase [uncultured Desulfobulbus sp.]